MNPYLDVEGFKARTMMPAEEVDALEAKAPGFLRARLIVWTSWINARLLKRYAVPFTAPTETVLGWLCALVTPEAYRKRGWAPSDEQAAQIEQDRKDAKDEVKEAADAEGGLFDLPLREDGNTAASAITNPATYAYSEASPYEWIDRQREAIRGR